MEKKTNAWRAVPIGEVDWYKSGDFSSIQNTTYLNGENYIDEDGDQQNNYYEVNLATGEKICSLYKQGKKYLHFFKSIDHAKEFAENGAKDGVEMVILGFNLPDSVTKHEYKGKYKNKYNMYRPELRAEYIIPLEDYSKSYFAKVTFRPFHMTPTVIAGFNYLNL